MIRELKEEAIENEVAVASGEAVIEDEIVVIFEETNLGSAEN